MDSELLDFDVLQKAEFIADIIECGDPFVSLFKTSDNNLWLRCWLDTVTKGPLESRLNQWLWVHVSTGQIKDYLLKHCTLWECFQKSNVLVEELRGEKSVDWRTVRLDQLNVSDMPDENSFLSDVVVNEYVDIEALIAALNGLQNI